MRPLRVLTAGILTSLVVLMFRYGAHELKRRSDFSSAGSVTPATVTTISRIEPGPVAPAAFDPGVPIPDIALVDQDGRQFHISDLRGRTVVLTFLYTHCELPSMCPATMWRLVRAQRLSRQRGLLGIDFVAVSFDPERDTPERLSEYAARYDPDFSSFRLVSGAPEEIDSLSRSLNVYYRRKPSDGFEHNLITSILDADGILREQFPGNRWKAEELAAAVERWSEP